MKFVKTMAAALCLGLALAQGSLWADGVTRSVEPVSGGCKVTLAWAFSGKVESDLVIEERFSPGWSVVDATVPFGSLDATWFSGNVARFAVKPAMLSADGSISFVVKSETDSATGTVAGDWQLYLNGKLQRGRIAGSDQLSTLVATPVKASVIKTGIAKALEAAQVVELSVAIKSFKVLGDSRIELSYSGVTKPGVLVIEGCEGLGKGWTTVKRVDGVPVGDGKVVVEKDEAGDCRFYRMKLLAKEDN